MQVIIDNKVVGYSIDGDNDKVVLMLHGWGDSKNTFNKYARDMRGEYSVLRVDLPGFGESDAPDCAWSLDDYGRFLSSFIAKINSQKIHAIIGHSNGGAVAIKALFNKDIKAENLILLASSGIRNTGGLKKSLFNIIAKIGKVSTFWLPGTIRDKLKSKLYIMSGSDMMVAPHMKETFKITVSQDILSDVANINIPTLLIYGSDDRATPPQYGKQFADVISKSELIVVDGAGHFLHNSHHERVLKLISDFLDKK